MKDVLEYRDPQGKASASRVWLKVWLALPDWVFSLLGGGVFLAFLYDRRSGYGEGFWQNVVWYRFSSGFTLYVPYHVLVDATYLLIALGFIVRAKPRERATRPSEILLPLIAAFWPFLPFLVESACKKLLPGMIDGYQAFMFQPKSWPPWRFLGGSLFIVLGLLIEVWGYAVLLRSLSIAAEARVLKTTGPYRWVRHPIYLGQFLAQGGIWLFYAHTHVVWIAFYLLFVAMQLYRSRVEDEVLARHFGPEYRAWKKNVFWFC